MILNYEAVDSIGLPFVRPVQLIGELPWELRSNALIEATNSIAEMTGLKNVAFIKFGNPVFCAFEGMNRNIAKVSPHSKLLLTIGADVSLKYCASYAN